MANILVLGADLGGMATAYETRAAIGNGHAITVISDNVELTPVPTCAPMSGFMIESMVTAIAHNLRDKLAGCEGQAAGDLERDLSGRHGRYRRGLRCSTANPATQCHLVEGWQVGPLKRSRLRIVLPAQDTHRQYRSGLREVRAQGARH